MTTIAPPAKLVYMLIADILRLLSVDAEAELDYRSEGMGRALYLDMPLNGTTVADILPFKYRDISADPGRYDALRQSMMERGQTAPIAVNAGYLLNGGHRVAEAITMGWPGMWVTSDHESSEDREWNEANSRHAFA